MNLCSRALTILSLHGGTSDQGCPPLSIQRVEEVQAEGPRPSWWRLQLMLAGTSDGVGDCLQGPLQTDLRMGRVQAHASPSTHYMMNKGI